LFDEIEENEERRENSPKNDRNLYAIRQNGYTKSRRINSMEANEC